MMCDFENGDDCQHAAEAERELIVEYLTLMLIDNKEKLRKTTGETRAIRLMGTIIGLEDAIQLIKSLD
jgi:hypothetical protein